MSSVSVCCRGVKGILTSSLRLLTKSTPLLPEWPARATLPAAAAAAAAALSGEIAPGRGWRGGDEEREGRKEAENEKEVGYRTAGAPHCPVH